MGKSTLAQQEKKVNETGNSNADHDDVPEFLRGRQIQPGPTPRDPNMSGGEQMLNTKVKVQTRDGIMGYDEFMKQHGSPYLTQYVPPSSNPVENTAEEWNRLRQAYLELTDRHRDAEAEIMAKDAIIEDQLIRLEQLQVERDDAVVVAVELKTGLSNAAEILYNIIHRATNAHVMAARERQSLREEASPARSETGQATTIADTVSAQTPEAPSRRTPLPDGPGFGDTPDETYKRRFVDQ